AYRSDIDMSDSLQTAATDRVEKTFAGIAGLPANRQRRRAIRRYEIAGRRSGRVQIRAKFKSELRRSNDGAAARSRIGTATENQSGYDGEEKQTSRKP